MNGPLVLLPQDGVRHLTSNNAGSSGTIRFRRSTADDLAIISFVHTGDAGYQVDLQPKRHPLNSAVTAGEGLWCRVPVDLHVAWYEVVKRGAAAIPFKSFKGLLPITPKDPGNTGYFMLTYAPDANTTPYNQVPIPEFAAWSVTRQGAQAFALAVEPEAVSILQLHPHWPVLDLATVTVMIIGVGSIGGAAATALAGYGVGQLRLIDPDRLMWHNLVRHVLPDRYIGQYKVDGLREQIAQHRPDTTVEALRLNVIDDADIVRSLLSDTDIILCCADGVAARRTASHLARRAHRPAVLACVLADGGIGEIIRLRPWPDHGCLLCRRRALTDSGVFDPEAGLEATYGTGTLHRPMTAVGSDLFLVGNLAAKVVVASALETLGRFDHRLPGEHFTIGLQAQRGWTGPFDLGHTGQARWAPAAPPRADCLTCHDRDK